MAHRAPGLGRQNCKQRLGEYAAEHGAVLGFAASAATSGVVGGRTNRACGVGVGGPSGPDSDETDEDGMDTDSNNIEEEEEEDMAIDVLTAHMRIVFEGLGTFWLPVHTVLARMTPQGASRRIEDTVVAMAYLGGTCCSG